MAKNNKKLWIGISIAVAILIIVGIALFIPTTTQSNTVTNDETKPSSSTSYFSRDSSGNFVPSAGIIAETPAQPQEPNIITQPAQQPTTEPKYSAQPEIPSSQITPPVQPKGYLRNLKISGITFRIGDTIKITGEFVVESPGDYYIEAGLHEASRKPLTITLVSFQSQCDQSKNYAGAWYKGAKAGDVVNFELNFKDYGITGKYNVVGGVYSGCGGNDIAKISPIEVSILSPQPQITTPIVKEPTNSNTNPPASTTPSTCTPSGYFEQLWIRKQGLPTQTDDGIAKVIGVFRNNAPCTVEYYIEAGMLESSFLPLALEPTNIAVFRTGQRSACDQNIHFSGTRVSLSPGQSIGFKLYPSNYGKTGKYKMFIGAYKIKSIQNSKCDVIVVQDAGAHEVSFGYSLAFWQNSWQRII